MKKNSFEKKLILKRETFANLDNSEMYYEHCCATGGTCVKTCPGCR
ncbi:MAG: hypothetical protein QG657_2569 [Acidobacteriota bacterium]|nr:hypothetical protein [Acidobacteriota bacterium]